MKQQLTDECHANRECKYISKFSMHYIEMYEVRHVYGERNKISRLLDVVTAGTKISYIHRQFSQYGNVSLRKGKGREQEYGHILEHVLDFENIQSFRDRSKKKKIKSRKKWSA